MRSETVRPSLRRAGPARAVAVVAVAFVTLAGCGHLTPHRRARGAAPTTTTTILRRSTPAQLHVLLDDDGRPYDAEVDPATGPDEVRYEKLGELRVPGGHLRVMDGNGLGVDPAFFADQAVAVEFGSHQRLRLGVIWQSPAGTTGAEAHSKEGVLGVRIDVPGTTVDRWGPFETAYGTDGGTGGITTQSVIDAARDGWDETRAYFDDDEQVVFEDWDGIPGADSLMFSNGSGDGGFPMARGFDRKGTLVSLVVWDPRYPWRLAVPDGTPPRDVTEREDQLLACLAGRRGIDESGRCAWE